MQILLLIFDSLRYYYHNIKLIVLKITLVQAFYLLFLSIINCCFRAKLMLFPDVGILLHALIYNISHILSQWNSLCCKVVK